MLDTWYEWKAKESGTHFALEAAVCPSDALAANNESQGTLHNTLDNLNGLFIMNIKATWITLQG